MEKTRNYGSFTRLDCNRPVVESHVRDIMESIKQNNMLHLFPIVVSQDDVVFDGQHRLEAAKRLGVDIYYNVVDLKMEDIIRMNVNRNWRVGDFFNFAVMTGKPEYIKLNEFMKANDLTLRIALQVLVGGGDGALKKFRDGDFIFEPESFGQNVSLCWETIRYIEKMNGKSQYLVSGKFWKALIKLFNHHLFKMDKWKHNLEKMVMRVKPCTSCDEYCIMLMSIYNWGHTTRLDLFDKDYDK